MKLVDHLDKIRAFKIVAESRTMGDAAKRLNITQPSLTKLIQTLETATGVPLLLRGRHGVTVTEAGQTFLSYVTATLNGLGDLEQRLRYPSSSLAGHIRIGAYASLGEYLWPEFIPQFRKEYPELRLSILSAEGISHTKALDQGEIDILVHAEPRLPVGTMSWNLYEDKFNFYSGKRVEFTSKSQDFEKTTLIYSPNAFDSANKKIIHHLEEKGYFFQECLEFDSFTAVLAFARKGIGLAVLPNRLAEQDVKLERLKPVSVKGFASEGFGSHHFAASILESKKDDRRIKVLIQTLRAWFKK